MSPIEVASALRIPVTRDHQSRFVVSKRSGTSCARFLASATTRASPAPRASIAATCAPGSADQIFRLSVGVTS
jgi:hypothetical protein